MKLHENSKKTINVGTSASTLLGVLFVALKLTGHITWSWWWVTLPFWGGLGLVLAIIIIGIIGIVLYHGLKALFRRKR